LELQSICGDGDLHGCHPAWRLIEVLLKREW
jgi:hypothetical protein